ncbi:MAG TPA: signal peptidase I [Pseudomonadales bacterium]
MDINLPLIMVLLSAAGIVIWLYDLLVLKRQRAKQVLELQQQYPDWQLANTVDGGRYQRDLVLVQQEPLLVRETKSLLPILLLVLVVRSFVVEPFQIPSSSMEPTLDVGDFILVNKYTYGLRLPVSNTLVWPVKQPQRGEVMVFYPPGDSRYFIKRVVGVPGDYIEYRNKVLYINGERQSQQPVPAGLMDIEQRDLMQEQLADHPHRIFNQPRKPAQDFATTVRPGHYFMMGDNRDNSSDSRYWGQVPEHNIVGRAFAIWMHWKDWKSLPSFNRVGKIQ